MVDKDPCPHLLGIYDPLADTQNVIQPPIAIVVGIEGHGEVLTPSRTVRRPDSPALKREHHMCAFGRLYDPVDVGQHGGVAAPVRMVAPLGSATESLFQ